MLELLKISKKVAIPAKYVLFDSWFSSPSTLHAVKSIGYDVIGMVKKTPKMFFRYNGKDMSLTTIYNQNKKRRGRSRYLLSVLVDVVKDGKVIPAKVLYVHNRNKRKEYLCLILRCNDCSHSSCFYSIYDAFSGKPGIQRQPFIG